MKFKNTFMRSACLLAGAIAWLASTVALAGTITQPSTIPFTVPGDSIGNPVAFDVTVSGFSPGALVYVEQCDGTPPTTQGWSPTVNCDLGSSPAASIVASDGTAAFLASDANHAFVPFKGPSPQGLFNCLSPNDPSPNNGLPDFRNCQLRVSTNNTLLTPDQAFVTLELPGTVAGATTTTTSSTTSTTTTLPRCSTHDLAGARCALQALNPSTFCTSDSIKPALVRFIKGKLAKANALLEMADTKNKSYGDPAAITLAVTHLEFAAVAKIDSIFPRVARDLRHKKLSPTCQRTITREITPVHDRLLTLVPQP
jgi:hypothetical protein